MWMRKDHWAEYDAAHKRAWDRIFANLSAWSLWWPNVR